MMRHLVECFTKTEVHTIIIFVLIFRLVYLAAKGKQIIETPLMLGVIYQIMSIEVVTNVSAYKRFQSFRND